jgi:nucleotide-binding universal stress UspA family protein
MEEVVMPSNTESRVTEASATDLPAGRLEPPTSSPVSRIAVGVDGYAEGLDATALGVEIARATGAELMLVAVHQPTVFPMPPHLQSKQLHEQAMTSLRELRDVRAPGARLRVESDLSVPRALHRAAAGAHRDLLVLGSSRRGPPGRAVIGKRTRQLLCNFDCPLAVATRGLAERDGWSLKRVGVGYDGGQEAQAALRFAAALALVAGLELRICGAVDDRVPILLRSSLDGLFRTEWVDFIGTEREQLDEQLLADVAVLGVPAKTDTVLGKPADILLALTEEVDLMVIGSRRWGATKHVLLGSTGEALLHAASCPVVTVPRP